ncbi:4-hydroxy-tetrahydrodipicolinate synthase [Pelagibius sp.]|uniref:4-hydroxy-tetrahydrodipicolinate synthase n=1 Tax=Pelagibius sp. TaxID=1931238 RepID=UPI003BAE1A57
MTHSGPGWRGSFPAIVTPFTIDGDLDERALRENVRLTVDEGSHGLVIAGHNGEAHLMSGAERARVIEIAVEEVDGRIPVIAGTGGIATAEVIGHSKAAAAAGVDGIMIEPPYFMRPIESDLIEHFKRVADAVDLPMMAYNNPARAQVDLTPEIVLELMSVARVSAIKDSLGDFTRIVHLLHTAGPKLAVFVGPSRLFGYAGITIGAAGFVDGLQQVAGPVAAQLFELAQAGDRKRGLEVQRQLFLLGEALFHSAGTSPATIKDAMRFLGRPGGFPRPPLRTMKGADLDAFTGRLRDIGFAPKVAA